MNHTHEDLGMGTHLYITHRPLTARAKRSRIPTRENARKEEHLPMYRLWAAMISQAITDVREMLPHKRHGEPTFRYGETKKAFNRRKEKYVASIAEGESALQWLEGREYGGLGFHDLCTALNLRSDAILSRLRKEMDNA